MPKNPPRLNFQALLLPLLLGPLIFYCSKNQVETGDSLLAGAPVQLTRPSVQLLVESIDLNATVVFLKKEMVRATFPGFIDRVTKNIGDQVRAGDELFTIKTREVAADDSLRLALGPDLFGGAVSIHAHSDGILTALNFHSGDFVSEGEEIAIIANPSSLCLALNVPYQYVSSIRRTRACEILLPDGRKFMAAIQREIPSVDPVSQTQTFLLRLARPITLPENLNVIARLALARVPQAVVLPRSAILSDETQSRFWIMHLVDSTTAVRLEIEKGIETDSLIQIIRPPLTPRDQVVCAGAYGLPDTARITITRYSHE